MPEILAAKRDGDELSQSDFQFICNHIESIPREQLGAFLMACQINGLNTQETSNLTRAMLDAGEKMEQEVGRVDKHSTGGVGDKMSIVLAPALRAAGATIPMLAGRGLAHTGGTIDKLEAIPGFNTGLSLDEMRQNPCFISRQTNDIAPADRILYSIRDITATVPQIGLITASIISKKAAEGLERLVLDVKCGNAAFMQTKEDAESLARSMVNTGNSLGMKVIAQITEMDNPIGMMFGNSHEIVECIQCLKGKGPSDTMELIYAQSDALGYDIRPVIEDGSALDEFHKMCIRQGVNESDIDKVINDPWTILPRAPHSTEILAPNSGFISQIHALTIGEILCKLGAGRTGENPDIDHGVGAELLVMRGEYIEAGKPWIRFDSKDQLSQETIDQIQFSLSLSDDEVEISSRILEEIH